MALAPSLVNSRRALLAAQPRRNLALVIIAIAQLMIVLDGSVVIVALPSAQHALHISTADRQWVVTAYSLAFGSLLLLGGRIADYVGRRRVFVIGLVGFGLASGLGGLAQNQLMLFSARALQGAFAALMAPSALSLLSVTFTEAHERARAFGVYGAVAGGGAALGLVLGGVLTQAASWRWTLFINVPIALATAFLAPRVIQESRAQAGGGYDVPGALAATGGLFSLVYGFTNAGTQGWGAPLTVVMLTTAAVLLGVFFAVELRSRHPLLPLRVLLDRNRGAAFIVGILIGGATLGTFLFLTYFLQGTLGYSALATGFAFLPFSAGIVAGATLASRLLPRVGPRPLMTVGLLVAALGVLWFSRLGLHSSYVLSILPPELLTSLGLGMTFVPMNSTALVGVDFKDAGVASAMVNTTQQVGNSIGTALLNTVATSATAVYLAAHLHLGLAPQRAAVHGYTTAFMVSACVLLLAATVAVALIRASRQQLRAEPGPAIAPGSAGPAPAAG